MLEASKYLEIVRKRGLEGKGLERVHRLIRKESILLQAYANLYSNKGATTPGISKEDVIDGMSMDKIKTLSNDLKVGNFKWKPAKRKHIPKKNGKKRPLGMISWSDKLVQEATRIVLEEYYEPLFYDNSHGFRRNKGCHTALNQIANYEWSGVKWFIEVDVKSCFDSIDHKKLMEILSRDIKDSRFLKLVKDMLEAGYIENWRYSYNYSGVPQGGVLSPLLFNIYMNEFDRYVVEELIPKYTSGKIRKSNKEYRKLQRKLGIERTKGNKESAREILKRMREIPSGDPQDKDFRRLKYVRYADDCRAKRFHTN